MRAAIAVLALGLVLAGTGCGGTTVATESPSQGGDAATLVPPDALAYVSADANLDSDQWRAVTDFLGTVAPKGDYEQLVKPALGDELNLAVLGVENGNPEAIALVKSPDDTKLQTLASKFDKGAEHYTVQRIGGWSVVADSADAFAAVRSAESGRSLADTADFQAAMKQLNGNALAIAYVDGTAVSRVKDAGALTRAAGSPRWVAAEVVPAGGAVQLDVHAAAPKPALAAYRPQLLRDVPSGALLAVSFKNANVALNRVARESSFRDALAELKEYTGVSAAQLAPALRGEGVFYVAQGLLLPTLVLEVESPQPAAAARTLRTIATHLNAQTSGMLRVNVIRQGNRVYLTNATAVPTTSGASLADDKSFKDALAAAGAPQTVTWLAYADLHRLVPIAEVLSRLLGGSQPSQEQSQKLDRLGTLVAYGARSGSDARATVRVTHD